MNPESNIFRYKFVAGQIATLMPLIVMAGWVFGIEELTHLGIPDASMKFNTALCLGLLGGGIIFNLYDFKKSHHTVVYISLAISAITFTEHVFNTNFFIDQLFIFDESYLAGRMSFGTALCIFLISISPLILDRYPMVSLMMLGISLIISFIALSGHFYEQFETSSIDQINSMAIHTALLIQFIAIAEILNIKSIVAFNLSSSTGWKHARNILYLSGSVFIILNIGISFLQAENYLSPLLAINLSTIAMLLAVITIIIWLTSKHIAESADNYSTEEVELRIEAAVYKKVKSIKEKLEFQNSINRIAKIGAWNYDRESGKMNMTQFGLNIFELPITTPISFDQIISFLTEDDKKKFSRSVNDAFSFIQDWEDIYTIRVGKKQKIKYLHVIGNAVNENGVCKKIEGTFQDITAIKNTEIDLNKERDFLQKLVNIAPIKLIVKDLESRIIMMNAHALKYFEIDSLNDVIGRTYDVLFSNNDVILSIESDIKVINEKDSMNIPQSFTTNTGKTFDFISSKIAIRNDENQIIGIAEFLLDKNRF